MNSLTPLEIVYQDDYYIAINKPHGLMVHRSKIASKDDVFALQLLRDQIGQMVYPAHRLDRKTSGVLLFALSTDSLAEIRAQFENSAINKSYLTIVRGFAPENGIIDYPLTNDRGKTQEAITHFQTIGRAEVNLPYGKHDTSRYSLVHVTPKTGRMHQIRKHFAHIMHPIIGDRPHGCNKQNRLFLEKWNMKTMLLHAEHLSFIHPYSQVPILINSSRHSEFDQMINELGFSI